MWGEALHGAWEKGAGALRGPEGGVEKGSVVEPNGRNLREFFDGTFEKSIGFLEEAGLSGRHNWGGNHLSGLPHSYPIGYRCLSVFRASLHYHCTGKLV